MFEEFFNRLCWKDLRVVIFVATASITILYTLPNQTDGAAPIFCQLGPNTCFGTSGDDIIYGVHQPQNFIDGLDGNDYIVGSDDSYNLIWGGNGNDVLVGSDSNDFLVGGRGNDKYDGRGGNDVILEDANTNDIESPLYSNNNDIISGGEGIDYIDSGFGADVIQGGPGDDFIFPDGYHRDFSHDTVNCGSGSGDRIQMFYSGDFETAINCEIIIDLDR